VVKELFEQTNHRGTEYTETAQRNQTLRAKLGHPEKSCKSCEANVWDFNL